MWSRLLQQTRTFETLLLHEDSSVMHALRCFEPEDGLVHTFRDPDFESGVTQVDVFELPRFDLSFEQRDGKLHSRNLRGFFMAACQQLSDTLHNFEQYLVLEDDRGAIKVMVPAGAVTMTDASVVIVGQQMSHATRAHHAYEVHSRFNTLDAANIDAQPDILIVFTLLSYYGDGLTEAEVKKAVTSLLEQAQPAQEADYDLWLKDARQSMSCKQLDALDSVAKLDLSNKSQLKMLVDTFGHNMGAINYWLNACVLKQQTMQFPKRLVTNAWNLTDNAHGAVIGFSGTQDNNLLLPLHVHQDSGADPVLRGTDGKMLKLILDEKHGLHVVGDSQEPAERSRSADLGATSETFLCSMSLSVLKLAVEKSSALVDAGATMAGMTNHEVAVEVLRLLKEAYSTLALQGVVFFDVSGKAPIINLRGHEEPLKSSPIRECDAFVYFDESHCRGADMKLKTKAIATLTIGANMCKDKLMQAAGRLRQLDRGQGLLFVVPHELESRIRDSNDDRQAGSKRVRSLQPLHLLHWVMQNTVASVSDGLPEWAGQGTHHCTTRDPRDMLLDENLKLTDLYTAKLIKETVYESCSRRFLRHLEEREDGLLNTVAQRTKELGSDISITSIGLDAECEREVECERELETETERQIPRQKPRTEIEWDFAQVVVASDLSSVCCEGLDVQPLAAVVKQQLTVDSTHPLNDIRWSTGLVHTTTNFSKPIEVEGEDKGVDMSMYLRPVDMVLLFKSGECLLLSDWEGERVLELLWARTEADRELGASTGPWLMNFAYLRWSLDGETAGPPLLRPPPLLQVPLEGGLGADGHATITTLQVFAGGKATSTHLFLLPHLLMFCCRRYTICEGARRTKNICRAPGRARESTGFAKSEERCTHLRESARI